MEALNCVGYFTCTNGKPSEWTLCENGLLFDAANQICNWSWDVGMTCYRVFVMQIYSKDASTKTFLHTFKIANAKVLLLLRSRPGTGPLNQLH